MRIEKSILRRALLHAPCPCSRLVQPPPASLHWMGRLRPRNARGGTADLRCMYLCFYSAQHSLSCHQQILKTLTPGALGRVANLGDLGQHSSLASPLHLVKLT